MKIKLFYKFILVLLLISLVPLSVVGLKLITIQQEALETSLMNNHITVANYLAAHIDDMFVSMKEKLSFLISSQSAQKLDIVSKKALIQALLGSTEYFISVALVDPEGDEFLKVYHKDFKDQSSVSNISDSDMFRKAVKTGGTVVSDAYRYGNDVRLDILYPMASDFLKITLNFSSLCQEIRNTELGNGAAVFLVNSSGRVLVHSEGRHEWKKYLIPPVEAVINRASSGSMEYSYGGEKMLGAYSPIESMGWGIVTEQPYKYAYEALIHTRKAAFNWILITFLASIILAYILAKSLTKPILRIADTAKRVSGGDFNSAVSIKTGDELQDLASVFNKMIKSLKQYSEIQIDKLMAEETKTKAIIFSINDGIVLTDEEGRILLLNRRAKELLSIKKDPKEGEKIFDYIDNESLAGLFKELKEQEIDISGEQNSQIIRSVTEEVTTEKGKRIGDMRIIRDITLEKEIENIKNKFLHSITHDLKNPLAAIISITELLKKLRAEKITEDEEKFITIMRSEAERLLGMINDILNLAKLEEGIMDLKYEQLDIKKMLVEIIDIFSVQAASSGVTLEKNLPESDINIDCDAPLIKRVMINLLGNSIKYTPRGGRIIVGAEFEDDNIRIYVSDNGVGIEKQYHKEIFDRFKQIKGRSKGGTGVGLNVVKEIIELHKGRVWVESEGHGKGSDFIFTLPLKH